MRNVAVATITVAVALSVAALRAQDMPFPLPRLSFPPPELMVAPIAPKQQPEEEALGVERRASICQELVAFLVRTQTTDPRPPTGGRCLPLVIAVRPMRQLYPALTSRSAVPD
jgi:hypothetical protein